jgi:hypothetical protein
MPHVRYPPSHWVWLATWCDDPENMATRAQKRALAQHRHTDATTGEEYEAARTAPDNSDASHYHSYRAIMYLSISWCTS